MTDRTPTPDREKHDIHHGEAYGDYKPGDVDAIHRPGDVENFHPSHEHMKNIDHGFDPHQVKKIIRKIDIRLIPILSAMYCISLIDRTNLSLARAANNVAMDHTLELTKGQRYTIATLIFFIPYIILEIPVSPYLSSDRSRIDPCSPRSVCASLVLAGGSAPVSFFGVAS